MHSTVRPSHQGTHRKRILRRLVNLRTVWQEDARDLVWLHWYTHKVYGNTRCYWYMVPLHAPALAAPPG